MQLENGVFRSSGKASSTPRRLQTQSSTAKDVATPRIELLIQPGDQRIEKHVAPPTMHARSTFRFRQQKSRSIP